VLERNPSPLEDIPASSASFLTGVAAEIGLQLATTIVLLLMVMHLALWTLDIRALATKLPTLVTVGLMCLVTVVYLALLCGVVIWLSRVLGRLFKRYWELGKSLKVAIPNHVNGLLEVNDDSVLAFVLLWINFITCLVTYRCFYDSTGTVNPGWTGVFG